MCCGCCKSLKAVIVSVCDWGYALSLSQFVTGGGQFVTGVCFVIVSVCDWGYALSLSQFVTGGMLCHCLSV